MVIPPNAAFANPASAALGKVAHPRHLAQATPRFSLTWIGLRRADVWHPQDLGWNIPWIAGYSFGASHERRDPAPAMVRQGWWTNRQLGACRLRTVLISDLHDSRHASYKSTYSITLQVTHHVGSRTMPERCALHCCIATYVHGIRCVQSLLSAPTIRALHCTRLRALKTQTSDL